MAKQSKQTRLTMNLLCTVIFGISSVFLVLTLMISLINSDVYMKNKNDFLSKVVIGCVLLIHLFGAVFFANNTRLVLLEEDDFKRRVRRRRSIELSRAEDSQDSIDKDTMLL